MERLLSEKGFQLIPSNVAEFISISEVKVKFDGLYFKIHTSVPCSGKEQFELFEVLTLPILSDNVISALNLEFKFIAKGSSKVAMLRGIDSCYIKANQYFCELTENVFNLHQEILNVNCEANMLMTGVVSKICQFVTRKFLGNQVVKISSNEFILLVLEPSVIRYKCESDDDFQAEIIKGHSYVTIPAHCEIEFSGHVVTARELKKHILIESSIAIANYTLNVQPKEIVKFVKVQMMDIRTLIVSLKTADPEEDNSSWFSQARRYYDKAVHHIDSFFSALADYAEMIFVGLILLIGVMSLCCIISCFKSICCFFTGTKTK